MTGINGAVTLSAGAGVWTVPDGVRRIRYILVGHGGAGTQFSNSGGGGGGGGYFTTAYMDVTPGQQLPWVIPSEQGAPTILNGIKADSGKMSKMLYYPTSLAGGATYTYDDRYKKYTSGGDGGSGGGGGYILYDNHYHGIGGCGGENGSNGKGAVSATENNPATIPLVSGGKGQGTSTRGFNGVLYSGGGGGAISAWAALGFSEKESPSAPDVMEPTLEDGHYFYRQAGRGGAGGGGNSEYYLPKPLPIDGTNGLGGGGGGSKEYPHKAFYYGRRIPVPIGPSVAGKGGTGCIYIAWGSLMNDGS